MGFLFPFFGGLVFNPNFHWKCMELKRFKSTLPPRQRDALRCFSRFFCPFFNWEVIRDCTTFLFLFIFFLFHIFHFCFLFFPRFPSTYSKRVVSNSEHIQRVNWSAPKHTDPLTSFYDWTSEKNTEKSTLRIHLILYKAFPKNKDYTTFPSSILVCSYTHSIWREKKEGQRRALQSLAITKSKKIFFRSRGRTSSWQLLCC